MRMSRLVGIHRHEEESLITYDYLSVDTRNKIYADRMLINTPVTDPNAKIQTIVRPEHAYMNFNIFVKHGNVEGGISEGLCTYAYDFGKPQFAAIDNQYTPQRVGDVLTIDQWYAVTAQFGSRNVQITIDDTSYTATRITEYTDMQGTWMLLGSKFRSTMSKFSIQDVTFYDQTDNVLAHLVPCVKHPGRYIGMYDPDTGVFYPVYFNNQMVTTHSDYLSVGNLT